jgi:hypothetical protein
MPGHCQDRTTSWRGSFALPSHEPICTNVRVLPERLAISSTTPRAFHAHILHHRFQGRRGASHVALAMRRRPEYCQRRCNRKERPTDEGTVGPAGDHARASQILPQSPTSASFPFERRYSAGAGFASTGKTKNAAANRSNDLPAAPHSARRPGWLRALPVRRPTRSSPGRPQDRSACSHQLGA